jgi:hypothetical protein
MQGFRHLLPLALAGIVVAGAAQAQQAPSVFFEGDLVRGGGPGAKGPSCVLNNQFKREETVVFRIRLRDAKTGQPLDDKGVTSLSVELSNGEKAAMHYGSHGGRGGPPEDFFWSGSWKIPTDYPTGSLSYQAIVTDQNGANYNWEPFKNSSSRITVIAN